MNQVGTRVNDREPSTAVVEIRLTRDEEIVHAHDQGIQVPTPDGRLSSLSTSMEESIGRTIMHNVMPQLDGPASTHAQRRQPLPVTRRQPYLVVVFLMIVIVILVIIGLVEAEDIQEEGGIIKKEVEDLLIGMITKVMVIQEEEDPP